MCTYLCVCWNNVVLSSFLNGLLPLSKTINRRCVEAAVQTSVSLSAQFNLLSYFDRKHYFYPDLPVSWAVGWEAGGMKEKGGRGREGRGGEGRGGEGEGRGGEGRSGERRSEGRGGEGGVNK